MTPTRWTATFEVRWRPLLTFGFRRLSLLEWFEDHLDVVEFHSDDHVGIAVGTPAHRLIVNESSLKVLLRSHEAEASRLQEAIEGTFRILKTSDMRTGIYRGAWSVAIDTDYGATCRSLAARTIDGVAESVAKPLDCAVLCDLGLASGHAQVEFGIVNDRELRSRLRRADSGRTSNPRPVPTDLPAVLPETSMFLDIDWHAHAEQERDVGSADQALEVLATVENDASALAKALQATL